MIAMDSGSCRTHGHTKAGGLAAGVQPPKPLKNRNLKNTDFLGIMISKFLWDLPFSRNQPLKSADDQFITILKKLINKLKKQ
jgi:hypothetical protein